MAKKKVNQSTIIRKRAMLEALVKTLGIVTSAADIVGITRDTHYKWLGSDEEYAAKAKDIENIELDFVESKLHNRISEGSDVAIIYYLNHKGRKRGYGKNSVDENNGAKIEVVIKGGLEDEN